MTYLLCLGGSALLCFLLFALRVRRACQAALSLGLSIVLGAVMAKLFYVLPMAPAQFGSYGLGCLVRTDPEQFSMFGGALGVCLGVALAARLSGGKAGAALDLFAPCGALLLALARGCEFFLNNRFLGRGVIGLGPWIDSEGWWCVFPFAVTDRYGMWYWAIFMAEAAAALIGCVLAVTLFRRRRAFLRTVYWLCALQLITEMFHSQTISWSFVRVEQVECAVAMLVILFIHGRHAVELKHAFRPCVLYLCTVPVVVYLEFELDKGWLSALLDSTDFEWCWTLASYDAAICYGVLCVIVVLMLLIARGAVKNRV